MFQKLLSLFKKKRHDAEDENLDFDFDDDINDIAHNPSPEKSGHAKHSGQQDEQSGMYAQEPLTESNAHEAHLDARIPVEMEYAKEYAEPDITEESVQVKRAIPKNLHFYIIGSIILMCVVFIGMSSVDEEKKKIVEQKPVVENVSENADSATNRGHIDKVASEAAVAPRDGQSEASGTDRALNYLNNAPTNSEMQATQQAAAAVTTTNPLAPSTPGAFNNLPPPPQAGAAGGSNQTGTPSNGSNGAGGKSEDENSGKLSKDNIARSPLIKLSGGSSKGGDKSEVSSAEAAQRSKLDQLRAGQQAKIDEVKSMLQRQGTGAGTGSATSLNRLTAASAGLRGNNQTTAAQVSEQWAKDNDKVEATPTIKAVAARGGCNLIHQGKIVPAALEMDLNSDLPGNITGVITMDVYDSVCSENLLIPRGSKFYGIYGSAIQAGQERIMAGVNRIILPNGTTINLGNMNVIDKQGATGVDAEVNNHVLRQISAGIMLAWITSAIERATRPEQTVTGGTVNNSGTTAAGEVMRDTAKRVLDRYSGGQPTLKVHKGERFNILVNKDMEIPTYSRK